MEDISCDKPKQTSQRKDPLNQKRPLPEPEDIFEDEDRVEDSPKPKRFKHNEIRRRRGRIERELLRELQLLVCPQLKQLPCATLLEHVTKNEMNLK